MPSDTVILERIKKIVATGRVDEEFTPWELHEILEYVIIRLKASRDGKTRFCPICGCSNIEFPGYLAKCKECGGIFGVE
jgi:hypothetical protein